MIELLIMRHAKSDWGDGVGSDLERPLAPRGVKAAKRTGRLLSRLGAAPELILSSPALRARSTAERAAAGGGWPSSIAIVPEFYGGRCAEVMTAIASFETSVRRILVVGHEPTWSDLVTVLCGGGRVFMPTAAVACLALVGDGWSELGPGRAELMWLVNPRMLKPLL
jgi:phosphohistidine phosphatase